MQTFDSRPKGSHPGPTRRGVITLFKLILALAVIGLIVQPVIAQTYVFWVDQASVDLYINADGTASVEYTYVFRNDPSADPIDAVDIGVPTTSYDLSSVTGSVNGQPVTDIENSPYVKPGVALNLGRLSIPPGQTGEVKVRIGTIRNMVFKANTQEAEPYASFQFTPNYFGSNFVVGQTNMTVTLHLPPGIEPDEPRYFTPKEWPGSEEPNEIGYDSENRVIYRWTAANASSSKNYVFGSAFPARVLPAAALMTEVPFKFDLEALCPVIFCLGFFGFIALTIYGSIVGDRKRKLQYLPPKLSVEGNGIKRGLTAVEAAIIMGQPMDKILTMILFSVIKKGAARVISHNPIKLEVLDLEAPGLQGYETNFVQAMTTENTKAQRARLQDLMTNLVKSVSEKMRGFSRKETVEYYQSIMQKAWSQVEAAQTPEVQMQAFDDAMDWTMLDRRFDDRTRETFGPRPVFMPVWWSRYDPSVRPPSAPSGPAVTTSQNAPPQGVSLPSLPGSQFAGSLVTGMQNFSSNVVGDLTSFTSGVTQKTNPIPKSTSSGGRSGGSGGGRSCACACACAGCACACAGGGR